MSSKFVCVLIGVTLLALCQAAGEQTMFYRPADGRVRLTPQSRSIPRNCSRVLGAAAAAAAASTPAPEVSSTSAEPTTINDVDYWDNDEFKPYKIDNRDVFDWLLMREIFRTQKTNVIISPFSVKFVLALLSEASDAESNTRQEFSLIFSKASSPPLLRETYHTFLESLREPHPNYTLNFATKMYLRHDLQPRPQYQAILKQTYDTDIQSLNFAYPTEAANIINSWCSNVTEGHLMDLVNKDNIQNSVLLLVNAIYFNGKWRSPFSETFESVFFRQPTEQIRAPYMSVTDKFYYFYSTMWSAKIVRLPYLGRKYSMTVILPITKGGIDDLIQSLEGDALRRIQWLMTENQVKVTLPKFKFDHTSEMKDHLMALNVKSIFSDEASLGGIVRGSSLVRKMKVSNIIQKAGIVVDETGTTAFAATDVEIVNKFGGDTIEEFNANRPFIFLITDEATSNIIFAGKVLDPTA